MDNLPSAVDGKFRKRKREIGHRYFPQLRHRQVQQSSCAGTQRPGRAKRENFKSSGQRTRNRILCPGLKLTFALSQAISGNPAAAQNQIPVVENGGLPWRDGALWLPELNSDNG